MTTVSLNSGKKKQAILALCILTYISAYLCRLNYASAILKIGADLEVNAAALGAVGSLFFISYAVGQLVNGFLGDRISPPRFILTAVVATGLLNVAMIFAGRLWVIALIWTVNGYVQSIFGVVVIVCFPNITAMGNIISFPRECPFPWLPPIFCPGRYWASSLPAARGRCIF